MSFKTDFGRVNGLGSAKEGTHHFWTQRISAVALLVLTPLFIIPFAINLGDSFEAVRASYANPFMAIIAALFVITAFYHLKLGLQVVIEDYIHGKAMRTGLIIGMSLFCALMGFTGLFAIAKIAFTGA
jgi:succinate dehydrogenase / fumarate reductase membrane anchor subunit